MDIRLRLILVAMSLIVAGLAYRRWRERIHLWIGRGWTWFWGILWDEKTCKVVEQFLLESAVLWFVFPLLDSMYDPDHHKIGAEVPTQAYILAGAFLFFAVVLSHAGRGGKN